MPSRPRSPAFVTGTLKNGDAPTGSVCRNDLDVTCLLGNEKPSVRCKGHRRRLFEAASKRRDVGNLLCAREPLLKEKIVKAVAIRAETRRIVRSLGC